MNVESRHLKWALATLFVPATIVLGACSSDSGNEAAQQGEQMGQQAQKQGEQMGQQAQKQGEKTGEEWQKKGEEIGEKYEKEYGG
jgi:preprotein translocase subunit SecG